MNPYILIVDDEENLTFFLKSALENKEYAVETVGLLADAKTILQSKFPDLMLLDLNLPDGNGLDLYRFIKDKGELTHKMIYERGLDSIKGLITLPREILPDSPLSNLYVPLRDRLDQDRITDPDIGLDQLRAEEKPVSPYDYDVDAIEAKAQEKYLGFLQNEINRIKKLHGAL